MLCTTVELAKVLKVHKNTIYKMVDDGRIPQKFIMRIGKSDYRYNLDGLIKYFFEK